MPSGAPSLQILEERQAGLDLTTHKKKREEQKRKAPRDSRESGHQRIGRTVADFRDLSEELKVQLVGDKKEGLASCLSFLGIELNTKDGVCRLP
ncbi:hypothetical protein NDU88_011639 [Pleurodeles waltl]|uniref:Uncharacterized protein n=1 Tax=Pleurodeles waltl TaxID=8319 RepID=A0AAV7S2V7_PLEWA|nr:hypothetical protein NDU88_011639 [Pleurodeles waltl]